MNSFYTEFIIRFFDVLLSLIALTLFFPLLIFIVIILKFTGEGEVFYLQERIGRNEKQFKLIKFATMLKDSAQISAGEITLTDDERVLPFGKFLRKTKINELPQLINILKGNLSIIGPRPQTKKYYYAFYPKDREYISQIRPGLSGIGSIIFRDEESLLENVSNPIKFDLEVITPYKGELEKWFVKNRAIYLYFTLISITILVVMFPKKSSTIIFFKDLPKPPRELKKILSVSNV